jgi:hypothetical protein
MATPCPFSPDKGAKLVVEKQEKRVGFTLQASKKMVELQMRLFDSIRNRKHRSSERFKKFGKRN